MIKVYKMTFVGEKSILLTDGRHIVSNIPYHKEEEIETRLVEGLKEALEQGDICEFYDIELFDGTVKNIKKCVENK